MPLSQDDPTLDYDGSWSDASKDWPCISFLTEEEAKLAYIAAWRDFKIPYGSYVLVGTCLRLETPEMKKFVEVGLTSMNFVSTDNKGVFSMPTPKMESSDFSQITDEEFKSHPARLPFIGAMKGRLYGGGALNSAWLWFKDGWERPEAPTEPKTIFDAIVGNLITKVDYHPLDKALPEEGSYVVRLTFADGTSMEFQTNVPAIYRTKTEQKRFPIFQYHHASELTDR